MVILNINEIAQVVNGLLISHNEDIAISSIKTHIANIKKGCLYIPTGGRVVTEELIKIAYEKGAAAVILPNKVSCRIPQIIVNRNTKATLSKLCRYYRCKFDIPVIGITGSAGKTSTKDMLALVLRQKLKVCKTKANINNVRGTIQNTLKINSSLGAAIFEFGFTGHSGFIKKLADIARPNIGIITNISTGHFQVLGSKENIMKAKMELTDYFDEDSVLIINNDDECLSKVGNKPYRVIKISTQGKGEYNAWDIIDNGEDGIDFKCSINGEIHSFKINTPGVHFVYSALACIAVGRLLNIDIKQIKDGIANFKPYWHRMRIIKLNSGIRIIDDCYNANLISMKAAVDALKSFKGGRKIAVLGDILEQGIRSEEFHRELGNYVINKCDLLVTVGKDSKYILEEARGFINAIHFETKTEVCSYLCSILKQNDVVLIKGSRGMNLDKIVEFMLKNDF